MFVPQDHLALITMVRMKPSLIQQRLPRRICAKNLVGAPDTPLIGMVAYFYAEFTPSGGFLIETC